MFRTLHLLSCLCLHLCRRVILIGCFLSYACFNVSKAMSAKLLTDRKELSWAFPRTLTPSWAELNWTLLFTFNWWNNGNELKWTLLSHSIDGKMVIMHRQKTKQCLPHTHSHTHTHTGLTHILAVDIPQGKWSGPHNSAWTLQWSSTRPCPSSGCPWWCCPPLLHTWHPGLPQGNHGHGTDPEMCQGMEPANCCLLTFSPHAPTTLNLTFCFYLSQKVHSASAVSKPYINHIYDTPLLLSQQFHSSSVSAKHIPS